MLYTEDVIRRLGELFLNNLLSSVMYGTAEKVCAILWARGESYRGKMHLAHTSHCNRHGFRQRVL